MNNNHNQFDVAQALASRYMFGRSKSTSGFNPNKRIKDSKKIVAAATGDDVKTIRDSTQNILPEPFNKEFAPMVKAFGATGAYLRSSGLPTDLGGQWFFQTSVVFDGSLANAHEANRQNLDRLNDECAYWWPQRINELAHSGVLSTFNRDHYPSVEKLRASFKYSELTFYPLPSTTDLRQAGIPPKVLEGIQESINASVVAQYRAGQMETLVDTMKYVKNMAEQLQKLDAWARKGEGRRPSIHATLTSNIREALDRMAKHADKNDPLGHRILEAVREVEDKLLLKSLDIEDIKARPKDAGGLARDAGDMADSLESLTEELFGTAPTSQTPSNVVEMPPRVAEIRDLAASHKDDDLADLLDLAFG